jgi:hypothetical protein
MAYIKQMSPDDVWLFRNGIEGKGIDKYYEQPPERDIVPLPALGKPERDQILAIDFFKGVKHLQELAGLGIVPTSANTCKTFFLTKKSTYIEIWDTESRFNEKKKEWETVAGERNLERLKSAFSEDFHVFMRGDDYYFLTQSGKLYMAPPAKKGEKSRTMKSLWEGDNFPIVAIIEDADNDKVWLFTKCKRKDTTNAVFFEMEPLIKTQQFDHAKLAPVKVEGRAKALLEYLPLIRAEKKKTEK